MKFFLKKTIVFLFFSTIAVVSVFIISNIIIRKNASYIIENDNEYLVIGHSHSECAINDTLVKNLTNMSLGGEAYFWTFLKIKQLISQNEKVNTVFIEFSNNQIGIAKDDWIWGDACLSNSLPTYYPFLTTEDISLLLDNNRNGFIKSTSKTFRRNLIRIASFNYQFNSNIGSYHRLNNVITDSLINTSNIQRYQSEKVELSNSNIDYLEKIIDFLKSKNIHVFLIRSPQHEKYTERSNEDVFMEILKNRFSDVDFFDFNDFPLKNNEFADFGHLNYSGANTFSVWLNEIIEKGLFSKIEKEKFIKSEIQKFRVQEN